MTALVFGLGVSGIGAARLALDMGYRTVGTDRLGVRDLSPETLPLIDKGLVFVGEDDAASELKKADLMIVSPGIPKDNHLIRKAAELGVRTIGEIEFGYLHSKGRIIGITGSNGKSTTTSIVHSILASVFDDVRLGGNIGTSFSSIGEGSADTTVFVLELSSFQLEDIYRFRPEAALLLNLSPDHQDRYPSFGDYVAAKARIFENQDEKGIAVFNLDDEGVREIARGIKSRKFYFSLRPHDLPGAFLSNGSVVFRGEDGSLAELFTLTDLAIKGPHNIENAMAASIAAFLFGAGPREICGALGKFRALPHRLEFVAEVNGACYYNDSKATNTDSVLKALRSFDSGVLLMLGGKDKGADFSVLSDEVVKRCRKVVAFGGAGKKVSDTFAGMIQTELFPTLREAALSLLDSAGRGDTVLLSPACASFDEFRNYEDRGEQFKRLVLERVME